MKLPFAEYAAPESSGKPAGTGVNLKQVLIVKVIMKIIFIN
jgi:hypothetical protein